MATERPVFPPLLILPGRVVSGPGRADQLLAAAAGFGRRGVLVHGRSLAAAGALQRIMAAAPAGLAVRTWEHPGGEPTLEQVADLRRCSLEHGADWVAAAGGGSVMDAAKAAAGLARASKDLTFYHDGGALEQPGLPFLAAPSTAGTGSEATVNAVLTNTRTGQKKSIRDDSLMARVVVLDPRLLAACPPAVIAHSGLDALTQALEAFASRHATWWSDQLCLEALRLLAPSLEGFCADPAGPLAAPMLQGSFLAGLGLSMARLGVVHGLAHPLGARLHTPHGQVCAACLPLAIEFNREAMGRKYEQAGEAVGGDILDKVRALSRRLGIRSPLAGRALTDRDAIIAETLASGSTKANPRPVTAADVAWFLDRLARKDAP